MSVSKLLFREKTNVGAKTNTTFNAPGDFPIPYGKTVVNIAGQGQPGSAPAYPYVSTNPVTYPYIGGNPATYPYANTNPTTYPVATYNTVPGNANYNTNPGNANYNYVAAYNYVSGSNPTTYPYANTNPPSYPYANTNPSTGGTYANTNPTIYYGNFAIYGDTFVPYDYPYYDVQPWGPTTTVPPGSNTYYEGNYRVYADYNNVDSTPGNANYNAISPGNANYNTVPGNANYNTSPGNSNYTHVNAAYPYANTNPTTYPYAGANPTTYPAATYNTVPGNANYNYVASTAVYSTVPGNANYSTVPGVAGTPAVIGGVSFPGGAISTPAPVVPTTPTALKYTGSPLSVTVPPGGYVTIANV